MFEGLKSSPQGRQRHVLAEVAAAISEGELGVLQSEAESADDVAVSNLEGSAARTAGKFSRHLEKDAQLF